MTGFNQLTPTEARLLLDFPLEELMLLTPTDLRLLAAIDCEDLPEGAINDSTTLSRQGYRNRIYQRYATMTVQMPYPTNTPEPNNPLVRDRRRYTAVNLYRHHKHIFRSRQKQNQSKPHSPTASVQNNGHDVHV